MRLTCCLCERLTIPAAFIGAMAVGPRCAARSNLLQSKSRKGSSIVILKRKHKREECETMDLFDDLGFIPSANGE